MPVCCFDDRVKDSSTTTGTGNFTLSGTAPTGYKDFNTAFGANTYFYYVIANGADWEVGMGYLSASTTLVRDMVLESTNADALVNFGSGTKTVFCDLPGWFARQLTTIGYAYALASGAAQP